MILFVIHSVTGVNMSYFSFKTKQTHVAFYSFLTVQFQKTFYLQFFVLKNCCYIADFISMSCLSVHSMFICLSYCICFVCPSCFHLHVCLSCSLLLVNYFAAMDSLSLFSICILEKEYVEKKYIYETY